VSEDRPPSVPPREADDRLVAGTITVGWAIALIVVAVLAARGVLPAHERWWVWVCVTGFGLGLWGIWYVPFLKRRRARTAAQRAQASGDPQASGGSASESRDSGSNTVSSTETPGSSTRS
jgi:hypothetical protein